MAAPVMPAPEQAGVLDSPGKADARLWSGRGVAPTKAPTALAAALRGGEAAECKGNKLAPIPKAKDAGEARAGPDADEGADSADDEGTADKLEVPRGSPLSVLRGPDWLNSATYPSETLPPTRCPPPSRFDSDSKFAAAAKALVSDAALTPRVTLPAVDHAAVVNISPVVPALPLAVQKAPQGTGRPPISPRLGGPRASLAPLRGCVDRRPFQVLTGVNVDAQGESPGRPSAPCAPQGRHSPLPQAPRQSAPEQNGFVESQASGNVQIWAADVLRPTVQCPVTRVR